MKLAPPQTWGELVALLTFLGLVTGYCVHQQERITTMERQLADRPMLMERRDRETNSIQDDIKQLRDKLLCPCH